MATIPLYQQQVEAGVQKMPRMSAEAAAAPWRGVAQAGQAVSQIGGQIAEFQAKKNNAIKRADTVEFNADLDARITALNETLSGVTDPDAYKTQYDTIENELTNWYANSKYSQKYGDEFDPYFNGAITQTRAKNIGIDVSGDGTVEGGRLAVLQLNAAKMPYLQEIESAYNGKPLIDNSTGEVVATPEQRIENAVSELAKLDPTWAGAKGREALKKYLDPIREQKMQRDIMANPAQALENIKKQLKGEGTTWNGADVGELKTARAEAERQLNDVSSSNESTLTARFFGLKYGRPEVEGDSFNKIMADAQQLHTDGKLKPEAFGSIMKRSEQPFGEPEKTPLAATEISSLATEISQYNPDEDPTRRRYGELVAKVNAIETQRDFSQMNQLLELVEKGGVASVHYKDLNSLIDSQMSGGIFGPDFATITPETGLLAKAEVAQYLRENPTDRDGAVKLLEQITANDKDQHAKDFYRQKYSYGTPANSVKTITIKAEFDALPSGSMYIGADGKKYRKP